MTLEYRPAKTSTVSTHDHIYTTLLGVFAFFMIMALASLVLMVMPRASAEARASLRFPVFLESIYLAASLVVLLIRLIAPKKRRWPTMGLNIALLIFIPLGTALGAYGLLKVDKQLRTNPDQPTPPTAPPPPPIP